MCVQTGTNIMTLPSYNKVSSEKSIYVDNISIGFESEKNPVNISLKPLCIKLQTIFSHFYNFNINHTIM